MQLMLLKRIFVNCYSSFSSDSSENEISLSSNPLRLDHTVVILVVLEIGLSIDSSKIGMLRDRNNHYYNKQLVFNEKRSMRY